MSASNPQISVIVLSYNSEEFLEGCLYALSRSERVKLEIICVDNQSSDRCHEIAENHPSVDKAIRTEENRGCAGGNNIGWRAATKPLVVFINPDCRVEPETLANLVNPMIQDQRVGVCGARLLYPNSRTIQHAGGILHPNAMCEHIGFNQQDSEEFHATREVDYVTGALIAFRRDDLEALGGFDEEYFPAYYEETDLTERVRNRGRTVLYVGAARAYHYESPGLTKNSDRFVRTSYRSRILFVLKNYTLRRFLTQFTPFELSWFFGPFAKGFRGKILRSYGSGAIFLAKCASRLSFRPKGVRVR